MNLTPEKRAEWREELEASEEMYVEWPVEFALALFDALDKAEQELTDRDCRFDEHVIDSTRLFNTEQTKRIKSEQEREYWKGRAYNAWEREDQSVLNMAFLAGERNAAQSALAALRAGIETLADEWESWATEKVLDINAERRSVAKAALRYAVDLRALLDVPATTKPETCCCETSPPEFGGSLPDRDCKVHAVPVPSEADRLRERLASNWNVFRKHRPAGAYLPIGQLDGDCHCGAGAWPCEAVLAVLADDSDIAKKTEWALRAVDGETMRTSEKYAIEAQSGGFTIGINRSPVVAVLTRASADDEWTEVWSEGPSHVIGCRLVEDHDGNCCTCGAMGSCKFWCPGRPEKEN